METKTVTRNITQYANYASVPDSATYTVTFSQLGAKVKVEALDNWYIYRDEQGITNPYIEKTL